MTHRTRSIRIYAVCSTLVSMLVLTTAMESQQPPNTSPALVGLDTGVPPTILSNGPLGELLAVYTPRNRNEIDRLVNIARTDRETSDKDVKESRRIAETADGRTRIMDEEVKTTKTRLNVAKQAKNEDDVASLTAELKRQENEMSYLQRVRDANKADSAWLDSKSTAASARVKALELEADVARKYIEVTSTKEGTTPDIKGYREVLKQMFSAQQEAANRGEEAASMEKVVALRRIKQLDELSKLSN